VDKPRANMKERFLLLVKVFFENLENVFELHSLKVWVDQKATIF